MQDLTNKIAAKLVNDGLTPDNYTLAKAENILSNCVAPVALKKHLKFNESAIKKQLVFFYYRQNGVL